MRLFLAVVRFLDRLSSPRPVSAWAFLTLLAILTVLAYDAGLLTWDTIAKAHGQ